MKSALVREANKILVLIYTYTYAYRYRYTYALTGSRILLHTRSDLSRTIQHAAHLQPVLGAHLRDEGVNLLRRRGHTRRVVHRVLHVPCEWNIYTSNT